MNVKRLVSAPFEVNVHVVDEDGRALVVDASSGLDWDSFAPRLQDALRGLTVDAIYLTHLHVDHVGGAARLARMTGAPLLMHEDEAYAVEEMVAWCRIGSPLSRPTFVDRRDEPEESLPDFVIRSTA